MSHNTSSIASSLKIRLGLDSQDLTVLLIKLLMCRPTALFWKFTKISQKQGIKSNEKLYNLKCAITDIYDVYLYFYWLLTLLKKRCFHCNRNGSHWNFLFILCE